MKSFKFFSAFLLFFIFPKCIFAQAIDVQKDSGLGDQIKMVSERIRLSYVDPDRCSQLLNFYGVNIGDPKKPIDKSKLPVVVVIPQTSFHETIPDHEKVFLRLKRIQLMKYCSFIIQQNQKTLDEYVK